MKEPPKEKYVNPFTDFGFKKLFGEEASKELLIDFLNQLLNLKHKIKDLTYKKLERLGTIADERKAVFDLYCENEKGEKFIVELQKAYQDFFKDRSIFYSTFPIREQAEKGAEWKYDLTAIYTIGILNFRFKDDKQNETIVTEVKLMDTKKNTVFFDKLTYIYLQIPNFKKTESQLKTRFDKWLYVLKNLSKFQDRPEILRDRIFDKLFQIAEISNLTKKEYNDYIESNKVNWDWNAVISSAENNGEKRGIEKGREEGKKEQQIEIAKQMLIDSEPIEKIIKYTGIDKEELQSILEHL